MVFRAKVSPITLLLLSVYLILFVVGVQALSIIISHSVFLSVEINRTSICPPFAASYSLPTSQFWSIQVLATDQHLSARSQSPLDVALPGLPTYRIPVCLCKSLWSSHSTRQRTRDAASLLEYNHMRHSRLGGQKIPSVSLCLLLVFYHPPRGWWSNDIVSVGEQQQQQQPEQRQR